MIIGVLVVAAATIAVLIVGDRYRYRFVRMRERRPGFRRGRRIADH